MRVFRTALVFLFFFPVLVQAQLIAPLESPLELRVIPAYPSPHETVRVSAQNITGSVGNTTFVWRVDGHIVDQGLGRNTISVKIGPAGSKTVIAVALSKNGTLSEEKNITVRPAGVDIVWEGNVYTPPWYHGKPLMNGSGSATLLAIPTIIENGVRVSESDLVYSWYINNSNTPFRKGNGVSSITVSSPQFENEFSVSVTAETRDGAVRSEKSVVITPRRPDISIYEKAPLLGLRFDRAVLNNFSFTEGEITFEAFPLYVQSLGGPTYSWSVDGAPTEATGETEREITFRKTGEGEGNFSITFNLEDARLLFERARQNFLLAF